MNVWDVSQAEHPHLHPCRLCWTSSQAETMLSAALDVNTLPLPQPSLLLPVSQGQERLELPVTAGEGCGFGSVLETPSKVFAMDGGQNFFLFFCNIPFTKQRELLCCSDTCLEQAEEGTGDPAV